MTGDNIIKLAQEFIGNSDIFEAPIFAFGAVDDELYANYKSPDVIGSHFLGPLEWMPGSKTVLSFFLPYKDKIKAANSMDCRWPADEWLYGRYEGQLQLAQLLEYLAKTLSEAGFESVVPAIDERLKVGIEGIRFTSNWSERHIAYACGLGTFGLSKGIITKKGMAGRLGSILTKLYLPKSNRDYSSIYEYCNMCGICISRCPSRAISFESGKDSAPCSDFLDEVMIKHRPRYGCGECQTGVPCESRIPAGERIARP